MARASQNFTLAVVRPALPLLDLAEPPVESAVGRVPAHLAGGDIVSPVRRFRYQVSLFTSPETLFYSTDTFPVLPGEWKRVPGEAFYLA